MLVVASPGLVVQKRQSSGVIVRGEHRSQSQHRPTQYGTVHCPTRSVAAYSCFMYRLYDSTGYGRAPARHTRDQTSPHNLSLHCTRDAKTPTVLVIVTLSRNELEATTTFRLIPAATTVGRRPPQPSAAWPTAAAAPPPPPPPPPKMSPTQHSSPAPCSV